MVYAKIRVDRGGVVRAPNRRPLGSFVGHLGRSPYGGAHETDHEPVNQQVAANRDAFRRGLLGLVRELSLTTVRYPNCNPVSGYRWEGGTSLREACPTSLDLAWHTINSNDIGDVFVRWCDAADLEAVWTTGTRLAPPSDPQPRRQRDGSAHSFAPCAAPGGPRRSPLPVISPDAAMAVTSGRHGEQ